MLCPSCRNPVDEVTARCDCGFLFKAADGNGFLGSLDKSVRAIKHILIAWSLVAIATVVLVLIVKTM